MTIDRAEFPTFTRRTALGLLGAVVSLPLAGPGGIAMAEAMILQTGSMAASMPRSRSLASSVIRIPRCDHTRPTGRKSR